MLPWRLLQWAFGVHGVNNLYELAKEITRPEISPVAQNISCPAPFCHQFLRSFRERASVSVGADGH